MNQMARMFATLCPRRSHSWLERVGLAATFVVAMLPNAGFASGRRVDVLASEVFVYRTRLMANTTYRIETRNLSQPSDTVLHVQLASGAYLAGNDDCPSEGSTRSCVTIRPSFWPRDVVVVVRAFSESTRGSGTLRLRGTCAGVGCTPSQQDVPIRKFGGTSFSLGEALRRKNKILTVRQPDVGSRHSATDTIVLVRRSQAEAIMFDDESGLKALPEFGRGMSKAILPSDCPACVVTVGTVSGLPEGPVTLLWDTDAGIHDCDGDGWGDSLEELYGADPCQLDTDLDGLNDGDEIEGVRMGQDSLQFAYWGARPNHKDLFLEVDWETGYPPTTQAAQEIIVRFRQTPH